ncbi:cell division topological specificity factor MinE [bacterium]|nr:cell division topological specificity factor MinE [bacterium]
MKTLIADIYNRILEFFQSEKSENTSQCATNRLQVILMHDRTKLDPLIMNKMREELIEVFSKYVVIDKDELEIGLKNEGDAVALMLNIPVVRAKTEEELNEIRKRLQEEEEKVSDDDDEEDNSSKETDEEADEEIVEEDEETEDDSASKDDAEENEEEIKEDSKEDDEEASEEEIVEESDKNDKK